MKLQVGVKALIHSQNDTYLFVRRSQKMGDEAEPHWDIPGGRINENEALLDALVREIDEETGLQLEKNARLLHAQDIFASHAELHVVRLTYRMECGESTVVVSDEHQEARWLSLPEARKLNLDPYLREALRFIV